MKFAKNILTIVLQISKNYERNAYFSLGLPIQRGSVRAFCCNNMVIRTPRLIGLGWSPSLSTNKASMLSASSKDSETSIRKQYIHVYKLKYKTRQ